MDIDKLRKHVQNTIPKTVSPDLDKTTRQIVQCLQDAIEISTPWARPTEFSRPGFTPECRELQKNAKQAHRKILRYHTKYQRPAPDRLWTDFLHKKHAARKTIQRFRQVAHRERVTAAAGNMGQVWRLSRWASSRTTFQAYTPPLQGPDGLCFMPEEKACLLSQAFFPLPPVANLDDIRTYRYPEPLENPDITQGEVLRSIRRPGADKAPGPDEVTNRVLQATADLIAPILAGLYNESLRQGYCPSHFRKARTIALRKPGKDDYSKPKSYRPIALLNTIGKVFEGILALRLSYFAEEYKLLPDNHFGGRKGQGTETALHMVTEIISAAWKRGKTATALFLDISGAFDNVSHTRLLHNLRKRRIPTLIVNWMASFLSERFTTLELPEISCPESRVDTGIPQGSPLSPVLYLFYNADMMESDETTNIGYIDDTTMMAVGQSPAENCRTLRSAFLKTCEPWSHTHASVFAPEKFALVHFQPKGTEEDQEPLDLGRGRVVIPSESAKLLGVVLDRQLDFQAHLQQIDAKCSRGLQAMTSLGRSKWGLSLEDKRRVYNACVAPAALYGVSVWQHPRVRRKKGAHDKQLRILNAI